MTALHLTDLPNISVRYPDQRQWTWNNGFRQRWLEITRRHLALARAIRDGGYPVARAYADMVHPDNRRWAHNLARSLVARLRRGKLPTRPYVVTYGYAWGFWLNLTADARRGWRWVPLFGPGIGAVPLSDDELDRRGGVV